MNKIKLGIIGIGFIGKVHLYNSLRLPNAYLTAVADTSKKALTLAKKMGVRRIYSDYQQLLSDQDIDAVIIALPTHLHADCAIIAAENNKHILLEKPLARNTREGKEILAHAAKHDVKLMVGHTNRFFQPYLELKERIDNYELGEIQVAYATNISSGPFVHRALSDAPQPVPEWWWKKEFTGGGALIDLGSHMINLSRWLFGDVLDAKCYLGHRFNLENEDHAICILKFKGYQIVVINVGWFSSQSVVKIEVYGTAGHALATHSSPSKIKTALQLMLKKTPSYYEPYFKELLHFVECIQHDRTPQPSGNDALKDLEVIELAYANKLSLSSFQSNSNMS
ncbi:MAG: Gfo/Idh/MocA family oxidoreductase [Candidatus Bathyarchaeia archaeon]